MNKCCTKAKLEQPLSENDGTTQTNDSKCFRFNVTKMQGDFLRKFCDCVSYLQTYMAH